MKLLTSASRKATFSSRSLMYRSLSWMTVLEFCNCIIHTTKKQRNKQCERLRRNTADFSNRSRCSITYSWRVSFVSPHVPSWLHSLRSITLYVSASSKSNFLVNGFLCSCGHRRAHLHRVCSVCVSVCLHAACTNSQPACVHEYLFDHVADFPLLTL